ncbi:MAG: restriction endonuclease [Selenomonas sp.]|nr:restriction endonuclease [Selenomonas sp.]
MNFWFHRISYEARVSYPLLGKGFLTIGFSGLLTEHENIVVDIKNDKITESDFNGVFQDVYKKVSRNRWFLWDFAKFAIGDQVVVPSDKTFAVFEVVETAKAVRYLPPNDIANLKDSLSGKNIFLNKEGFISFNDDKGEEVEYDLGFFVKVKPVTDYIDEENNSTVFAPRSMFLKDPMMRRLKSRSTNGQMNDLQELVKDAVDRVKRNEPLNFRKTIYNQFGNPLKKLLQIELTDKKFESLVQWYMYKLGADDVEIPSKNSSKKPANGDADIIAFFEKLKLIIYVQVKHYSGTQANTWAITQIQNYIDFAASNNNDYTCAAWVISSCDRYSDNVKNAAIQQNAINRMSPIRLIDGNEFAEMMLDVGFGGLGDVNVF